MARITPLHLIPALIAAATHAAEVTIARRPFFIEKSFTATALPGEDCTPLRLDPKSWQDFKITHIAAHGAFVKKGESLVRFDAAEIDEKLLDARRALESGTLSLAQAVLELKLAQDTAPDKLDAARRAAAIAKEENTYFTRIRRKAAEESAAQALKRNEQFLSNQREELKQLTKMYEADDITENTEEIILIRQQDAVAAAEFALRMEVLDHKRTLEVTLPREAETLANSERDTALALKKAEEEIPRSIELRKLSLATLETAQQRAKQDLIDLEADRALFEIKAPADGCFYHGPIENGRWTPGDLVKSLLPHGQLPVHKPFATFVPGNAKFGLIAFLDDATARSLAPDLSGSATLAGREDVEIPVKLAKIATIPGPDGTYRADFTATWPAGTVPAAGAAVQIRVVSYQQESAIAIPHHALSPDTTGWTVNIKLADGKTERRAVKRGRLSKEETEILEGLEEGQVIFVPDK
jgi:HlyD family secretion protein